MSRIKYLYQGEYTIRHLIRKGVIYHTVSKGDSEDFELRIFDEFSLTPLSIFEEHVEKASRHFGFDLREYEIQLLGEEVAKVTKKVPPLAKVYQLRFLDGVHIISHFECGCEVSGSVLTSKCSHWCSVTPNSSYKLSEYSVVSFYDSHEPLGRISLRELPEGLYVVRAEYAEYAVYLSDDKHHLDEDEVRRAYPEVDGILRGGFRGVWIESGGQL